MKLQWKQIDWKQAEEYVNRLQVRIVKATLEQRWRLVKRLQYLITHSFYAKALAVKRVTGNKGRKTPGIDGEIWATDREKAKAVVHIDTQTYHALPLKRVYIEKFGKKKKRPLGIPVMKDRAMQALQLLGLEPVAETMADRISFGFRKYRNANDAMEYAFSILSRRDSARWILEGDIKSCFDKISHEWMMQNIPADKRIMKEFMRCGYIQKGKLHPTEEGSPQGGIISPTYANMALDGLEPMILGVYWANKKGTVSLKHNRNKVHVIRFADDFIVTASSKEVLEEIRGMIKEFLAPRGLCLSEEKTLITSIYDGFNFLGWNFRKFKEKLIIKPARKSVDKATKTVSQIIKDNQAATQDMLIYKINEVTRGWANYHHSVCAKSTFSKLDHRIWEMLWKWAKRRHPNKGKHWIKERYWKDHKGRKWSFMTEKNILFLMSDMPIVRIGQVALNKNPFLDREYYEERSRKHRYNRKKAISFNKAAQIGYYAL